MKILLITDLYPLTDDKTIPKIVEDFALGFKNLGHFVCVIRPNFLFNTILRKHKVIKNGIYFRNDIKIYNKNFILPFFDDDISYLEDEFDLIISHLPCGHIYADLINKKLKIPHISIIHQSDYKVLSDFKYSFYFKKRLYNSLKNSNLIGARNKFLYEKLDADFILPSFVEEKNILANKTFNDKKLKIITLSKLIKRKNIDLVIKALLEVNFNYEYSIYGEGVEYKKLKKLIKKYNLDDKIKIYPFIEHNLIWEKLDENDVFVLPSINETFGISYLEALSRGLIVVGVNNTGIDGIIENNKNGFLINPDIQAIKEILEKINSINKEEISKNALDDIKKYTKENIMKKYVEIVKKTL